MTLENTWLFLNGQKVAVRNVEISYDGPSWQENAMQVRLEGYIPSYIGVDIANGNEESYFVRCINGKWEFEETTKKEDSMDRCEEKASCDDGSYGGERLARQIKELELTDDQRKLRKYGLVNEVGLITHKGKEVLLNHLLAVYTDEIVEDLQALEDAEEKKEAKAKK